MTSPVAGLVTTPCRLPCDVAGWPLIHSGTRATVTGAGAETVLDIGGGFPGHYSTYSPYEAMDPADLVDLWTCGPW